MNEMKVLTQCELGIISNMDIAEDFDEVFDEEVIQAEENAIIIVNDPVVAIPELGLLACNMTYAYDTGDDIEADWSGTILFSICLDGGFEMVYMEQDPMLVALANYTRNSIDYISELQGIVFAGKLAEILYSDTDSCAEYGRDMEYEY